jgi:alanyl-tRNA synthetase
MMTSNEVRSKFLKFFESKGHKILPSSSLIPDDPSVLFTTAGMQQFKSYYTSPDSALKDFGVKNVTTSQKCVRTGDIDEVGDNTHLTFFEMLGNFSFGGYGRKEAIEYAHEFITKEMGLEISYVTIYEGNINVPKDEESKKVWGDLGMKDIREEGSDVFWGPTGDKGPCGPTTEIYCKNASGEDVEIWNIVFNEYFCDGSREKLDKGEAYLAKLPILGVDTGMGLERLVATVQNKKSVYETDLFENEEIKKDRIIADHIKAALFIISDGVTPSNTGAGYVLRRLIRRISRWTSEPLDKSLEKIKKVYEGIYILDDKGIIKEEEEKFKKTLDLGLKEFEKGIDPFILFTTYGFPIEMTEELAHEKGVKINRDDFDNKMKEHQKLSQTSSAGMFKGGLANHEPKTIKLHTAHHLLLAGLQAVVNPDIKQRGSNITEERLRMDFICDHKLTEIEKKNVEDWVNDKIMRKFDVIHQEMPLAEAEKIGAQMEFGAKYPDVVSTYFIKDENGEYVSKEFCGGPHVSNTGELGASPDGEPKHFKIQKEEAVAAGIRRIKAVLN